MARGLDFLDNRVMFQSRRQNLGVSRAPQKRGRTVSTTEASTEYLLFRLWDWLSFLVSRVAPLYAVPFVVGHLWIPVSALHTHSRTQCISGLGTGLYSVGHNASQV